MAAQFLDFHQFNESYLSGLRAQDGATEAHFVSYFSRFLHGKLRRRLACPEHIKDVQQETLLRALTAIRAKNGIRQPERFGSFMSSVCNNILRETYRSRARTRPLEDLPLDPVDQRTSPDGTLLIAETKKQVRDVLGRLPGKDRELLQAVFFEQRNKDEVCRDLGVSRDYLRVLLHRAKRQFIVEYNQLSGVPKRNPGAVTHHRQKPAP
jgi:RNA polymerase sigma-70 factor (ECF subfamily)